MLTYKLVVLDEPYTSKFELNIFLEEHKNKAQAPVIYLKRIKIKLQLYSFIALVTQAYFDLSSTVEDASDALDSKSVDDNKDSDCLVGSLLDVKCNWKSSLSFPYWH